jgi:hypothetical protein
VFPILASALPDFGASEEDWKEPLAYIFNNEMVDFVCLRESEPDMIRFADLLERLLAEGDDETRYLAMDAIETFVAKVEGPVIAKRFGPKAIEIWSFYSLGVGKGLD